MFGLAAFVWVAALGCSGRRGNRSALPDAPVPDVADVARTESDAFTCNDGADNDGDGMIDCADSDCVAAPACLPPVNACTVTGEMDAVGNCEERALPESFEPDIQWTWRGSGAEIQSIVTPLVANLTDDNDDGAIDLCDVPDVIVVAAAYAGPPATSGHIYVLDGATGTLHFQVPSPVDSSVTPAIGDIDGDGLAEIVTAGLEGTLVAFEHDGTIKWRGDRTWTESPGPAPYSASVALADLDNDGDVEVIAGGLVADHLGETLWVASELPGPWSATTAADLDDDGDLEVVLGHAAFRHDGTLLYRASGISPGYPQVADFDMDGTPEVLVTNTEGITLLEHDGRVRYRDLRPTGAFPGFTTWVRPATIHDFDGDGVPEYALSSASTYSVYEGDGSILWSAVVSDESGIAAGTAFDFLGDGIAEAMYADERNLFIFDGTGSPLFQIPRESGTLSEYPVVADIDNDGSAEIVVVTNEYIGAMTSPTVQAIRDVDDRWIQARRIWNQHTYHVTNVREDATIPQFEPPSWLRLNTFRTNAQIEGGSVCKPPII